MRSGFRARRLRVTLIICLALAPVFFGGLFVASRTRTSSALTTLSVSVAGNRLVDASGNTLRLRGVNRSGAEYACANYPGWGFFDGPVDQASVDAIKSWNVNAVRLPLNEACWLGIDGTGGTYGGQNYINAITSFVNLLNANGIYVILDYQWGACGSTSVAQTGCLANWQKSMPDRPNATTFWASVAANFKDNHAVLFDAFNEPYGVDWNCWLNGGCVQYSGANQYVAEGMQPIVTAIRTAGATTQPIMLGGLSYSNDESQWLSHMPVDPDNGLVLSLHLYDFNSPCNNTACLSSGTYSVAPVAAKVPVVIGEFGEGTATGAFDNGVMNWADQNGYSYLAWTWDTWGCSGTVILSNYNGSPCSPNGSAIKNHYLAATTTPTTTSGPVTTTTVATTTTTVPRTTTTTAPTTTTTAPTTTTTAPAATTTTTVGSPPPTDAPNTQPVSSPSSRRSSLSVDTVVKSNASSGWGLVSPTFSTSTSGELVVAFISSDGPGQSGTQSVTSVYGGGLRWSRAVASNGEPGAAEIWTAFSSDRLRRVQVTAKRSVEGYEGSITVAAFTGASSAPGAVVAASRYSGAPSATLSSRAAGSVVWAVGHDWDAARSVQVASTQSLVQQFTDTSVGDTSWVQRSNGSTASIGTTVTASATSPVSDCWNLAAIEIRPA